MRITHLGHACLLVDAAGVRILIDPGNLSDDFTEIDGLDVIAVTHQHPDHADPERIPALVDRNQGARLVAEPGAAAVLTEQTDGVVRPEPLTSGDPIELHAVTIRPVGELHAVIDESVPRIGNFGIVVTAPREPILFHPGDSYDAEPGTVDVLGVPINAPWAKVSETARFVRRIAPRIAIPIHNGLLSARGQEMYQNLLTRFGPAAMELHPIGSGVTETFN